MRKWANYADPHHRILLDALSNDPVFNKHEYKAALNVQAEMIVMISFTTEQQLILTKILWIDSFCLKSLSLNINKKMNHLVELQ